jgi:aspartate-semialdehyde dehydrogenase
VHATILVAVKHMAVAAKQVQPPVIYGLIMEITMSKSTDPNTAENTEKNLKTYSKPQIVSVERMEAAAAICNDPAGSGAGKPGNQGPSTCVIPSS